MKNDSIQYLLEKYREGTLNDEERVELERLTHKDEVFAAAGRKVRGIIWQRVSLAVAAIMVTGVGMLTMLPREQEPLVAEAREFPISSVETQPAASPVIEAEVPQQALKETQQAASLQRRPKAKPTIQDRTEPVVVCNNQCEADSVISDIRKFLSV